MFTNTNSYSLPQYNSKPSFATLKTSSTNSGTPMMVLNTSDPPYDNAIKSFDGGKLNPRQGDSGIAGRNYFTIDSAYGEEPTQIYSYRSCSGNGGNADGYLPPPSGYIGSKSIKNMNPTTPSQTPTSYPSQTPTSYPTSYPSQTPTSYPSQTPTSYPTSYPSQTPTSYPTSYPSQTPSAKINKFFQETPSPQPTYGSIQNPMFSKNIHSSPSILGSGQILIRGQGLTSAGGSKFAIQTNGKICISPVNGLPDCFFPKNKNRTVALNKIIMHPSGEFQMLDVDGKEIPLIFSSKSRPLSHPIPGSYGRLEDDTSFSILSPNGSFLYNVF